jgi:hypothetical protein
MGAISFLWVLLAFQYAQGADVTLGNTVLTGTDTPSLNGEFFGGMWEFIDERKRILGGHCSHRHSICRAPSGTTAVCASGPQVLAGDSDHLRCHKIWVLLYSTRFAFYPS